VERIADRPLRQYGGAVHAAAVCAGTGTGRQIGADSEHAAGARRIGWKSKPKRQWWVRLLHLRRLVGS